jgi:hypothetical protein
MINKRAKMNKKVSFVLGVLVGGVAGSGVTYYVLKERFDKTMAEKIAAMEEDYAQCTQDILVKYGIQKEEDEVDLEEVSELMNDNTTDRPVTGRTSIVPDDKVVHEHVDYHKIYKGDTEVPDINSVLTKEEKEAQQLALINDIKELQELMEDEDDDEDDEDTMTLPDGSVATHVAEPISFRGTGLPFVISNDDFEAPNNHHDKVKCVYHAVSDTLVELDSEEVLEIDPCVGRENLNPDYFGYGLPAEDKDRLLIRNDRLGIDYDIYLQWTAFVDGETIQ